MIGKIVDELKIILTPCQENKYRPKLLESKFLFYYALLLLFLKLIIIPFFLYFPQTIFFADLTKTRLIGLVNDTREYFGLQPLKESLALNQAAYLKAKDMLEKGYFSHYSPEGITPWYWLKIIGYNYRLAGENLAIGFLDSEQVHQAWLNSNLHRQNILNPNFQETGIAVLRGNFQNNETSLVVQFFGAQKTLVLTEKTQPAKEPLVQRQATDTAVSHEKTEPFVAKEDLSKKTAIEPKKVISLDVTEEFKKTPSFVLFQFITSDYYDLIQKIIYGSLAFIIFSLFLTIFYDIFIYRRWEIQYKDVILKGVGFVVLWIFLVFLDKFMIIQSITSNFRIE